MSGGGLIDVRGVKRSFRVKQGLFAAARHVAAIDDVSFAVAPGDVLGIVGESGCGKSTLARVILGLLPPTAGEVLVDGRRIAQMDRRERARLIQPVFQDPFSSLNPRRRVRDIVAMPLDAQGDRAGAEVARRVDAMLERVGLSAAQGQRYPAELSGGQRQRVAIARALVLEPRIVVCDEPTSALDVSVQAQILNLLAELRRDLGLTYLFISHNLAIVERRETAALFGAPAHPYTKALLASVLTPEPGLGIPDTGLGDTMPDPSNVPPGCRFHPRCPVAIAACRSQAPALTRVAGGQTECHLVAS